MHRGTFVIALTVLSAVVSCQEASEGVTHKSFTPGVTEQALTVGAAVRADGSTVLDLLGFALLPSQKGYYEAYQSGRLEEGERITTLQLLVPSGLGLPFEVGDGPLPAGLQLQWWHSESPTDPTDPLCSESPFRNAEGDVVCVRKWIEETTTSGNGLRLAIRALDVRSGGNVDLSIELSKFAFHDPDGGVTYCCGTKRLAVRGTFNSEMRAPLTVVEWNASMQCGYTDLDEVPSMENCPASY